MHFQQVKGGDQRCLQTQPLKKHPGKTPKKDRGSCISSTLGCLLHPEGLLQSLNVTLDGFPLPQQWAGDVGLLGLDSRDAQLLQPSTCLFAVV